MPTRHHSPHSALDVAELILEVNGPVSAMKLQKLVYYTQAWHLALHKRPLFHERVEAWVHGPAISELYQVHAGSTKVTTVRGNAAAVAKDTRKFVQEVLGYYGHLSASDLRRMSHDEGPWKEARGKLPEEAPSTNEITHESMRAYYSARPWGKAKPMTDLSVFSPDRVRTSRKDIEAGRFTTLGPLDDAVQGPDS
jgi:uncharacterized phage-associated protein